MEKQNPEAVAASDAEQAELPAVPLTDVIVLPQMIVPIHLDAWADLQAVEQAMMGDKRIFLAPQNTSAEGDAPLREIGVVATVEESRPSRRGGQRVVVRGTDRAVLESLVQQEPYLRVSCRL